MVGVEAGVHWGALGLAPDLELGVDLEHGQSGNVAKDDGHDLAPRYH